jgi:hypothetical protein
MAEHHEHRGNDSVDRPAARPTRDPQDRAGEPGDERSGRALLGTLAGAVGVAALAGLAGHAEGGPINPPSGPIASTAKPLQELEPRKAINTTNTPGDSASVFRIGQPGSYYLTRDVVVPSGKAGIIIGASDVTVDLNGFRILGNLSNRSTGITDLGIEQSNVTIRNGTIEAMGSIGVFLLSKPVRLVDLVVRDNGSTGVLMGTRVTLERVVAVNNAEFASSSPGGIIVGGEGAVIDCVAEFNHGVGISAGAYVLVRGCRATHNTGNGIDVAPTAVVVGCDAYLNEGAGITCQHGAAVEACTVSGNRGVGLSASFGSTVRTSVATGNLGGGYALWEGCAINDCVSDGNTGLGMTLSTGCQVARCVVEFNSLSGIDASAGPGSSIARCVTRNNGNSGIVVGARCMVLENNCETNATIGPNAAGIQAAGPSNRIEGNLCGSTTGYGIWVTASRNYILRNSCVMNLTNWSIFSNCVFGTVVDRTSISVSGMSGNGTVASTVGTSDPFANVSF